MPKTSALPFSRYSQEAASLLGQLIRRGRIERKMTAAQLAERIGISRGLVQRIEKGDLGCAIGAVFEAAAITGVRLFDADQAALSGEIDAAATKLALLPKAVRKPHVKVQDDF